MAYQKDELLEVMVEDLGSEGEGIGKTDGYTWFVKDAIPGDHIQMKVLKTKKNYGYGRLEKVIVPSPYRVQPKCSIHRQCGGCQIQAVDYEEQLRWKNRKVKNALVRIGGYEEAYLSDCMESPIGMEDPYRYRNKAQYPIGVDRDGNYIAGFYAGRTHVIIPQTDCIIGQEHNREILQSILEYMKKYNIRAYQEETGEGVVRHVLIRSGYHTGQIMVCLIINAKSLPREEELVNCLREFSGITSISLSSNLERNNTIMGKEVRILWGNKWMEDELYQPITKRSIRYQISPLSFYQVNPVQTEKLYAKVLQYAGLQKEETAWDIYCGIGTISLFLASTGARVYGVEIVPQAIDNARENARINNLENATFYVGLAEEVLPELYQKEGIKADLIVLDPPRKGCDPACLETVVQMKPSRIVYVSCDPATLARDLKYFREFGYELKKVQTVDMFPHSVHVETVCLLHRN